MPKWLPGRSGFQLLSCDDAEFVDRGGKNPGRPSDDAQAPPRTRPHARVPRKVVPAGQVWCAGATRVSRSGRSLIVGRGLAVLDWHGLVHCV